MIIRDSWLRDVAKIFAWYPLRWFVMLSPWPVVYMMGRTIGVLDIMRSRSRWNMIRENVLSALGGDLTSEDAGSVAGWVIKRHYIEHVEFYKFASLTADNIDEHIVFEGMEHLENGLKSGKGVVLVHMHFGSKQFPLVALGLKDYPVSQVGYRDSDAEDYSFIHKNVHLRIRMKIEAGFKCRHVHLGKSLRPAYDALKNNQILMITGDGVGGIRGAGESYIPVSFLGKTMMFPQGPARMAYKTGAAIIPMFCVDRGDGTYKAIIEQEIVQQRTDDRAADVLANTKAYVNVFERYVREYPDHWMFWEEFKEGNLIRAQGK